MRKHSHTIPSLDTAPSDIAAVDAFCAQALAPASPDTSFETVLDEIAPSIATASPAGRGMYGSYANHRRGRLTAYWSDLERKCLHCLQADPNIKDVWEQPPAMTFIKRNGEVGTHRWDALIVHADGSRQYVYIKPLAKLIQPKNNRYAEFLYLASWADPRIATSARVMSEWNLDPTEVDTAEVYNQALATPRPSLAEWVIDQIRSAGGSTQVDIICRRHVGNSATSPIMPPDVHFYSAMSEAYWAILWLLAAGELQKSDTGFISTFSYVQIVRSA